MRAFRVIIGAIVSIACALAVTPARAQNFSTEVDLRGDVAVALAQGAEQIVHDNGLRAADLKAYGISYASSDSHVTVAFTSPKGVHTSYDIVAGVSGPIRRTQSVATLPKTIPGPYVAALSEAFAYWKTTAIGLQYPLSASGSASVVQPFKSSTNLSNIYWVYFSPPEPKRPPLTIGCGIDRGFAVNLKDGGIKALKPVC